MQFRPVVILQYFLTICVFPEAFRPTHSDDLRYIYSPLHEQDLPIPPLKPGSENDKFSKKLVSLFVSFAKEGCVEIFTEFKI